MSRRSALKARSSTSAFLNNEDRVLKKGIRDEEEMKIDIDPFTSFQSMETMLGNQRMELHRCVHAYHETAMKFLTRKEENWAHDLHVVLEHMKSEAVATEAKPTVVTGRPVQKALMDVPEFSTSVTSAWRQGGQAEPATDLLSKQLKSVRMSLVKTEEQMRHYQSENFELREQLAAMQAVGSSYSGLLHNTLSDPNRVPSMQPAEWPPSPVKVVAVKATATATSGVASATDKRASGTVEGFFSKLDTTSSDPLDRLERAQSKLDAWATAHHPCPDPEAAGLVNFNTMEIPDIPGTMDAMTLEDMKAIENAKKHDANGGEEEDEDEEDGSAWAYFRTKKKMIRSKTGLDMKQKTMDLFSSVKFDPKTQYKTDGCIQTVARSPTFENGAMVVIALNALWIGIDMSWNDAPMLVYADWPFIVIENIFCTVFFLEILIRFLAYRYKLHIVRDYSFLFDAFLVAFMVFETWVLTVVFFATDDSSSSSEPAFDSGVLRLFKLLRITRAARIARLVRQVPEVMILLKGISVASRSVLFTCVLCTGVVYMFAIVMTQLSEGTELGEAYFSTLTTGMASLLYHGCFFNGVTDFANACFREHVGYGLLLFIFILVAPLTVMNMIVGVLVEVVGVVAAAEQEIAVVGSVTESLREALGRVDGHGDERISKEEFATLADSEEAMTTFNDANIDILTLLRDPDIVFAGDDEIDFKVFLDEVLLLRGSNVATVKDIILLKKQLLRELKGGVGGRPRSLV
eukprot:TRINITY_DN35615_c0_g1_i2.p1 TRINITY_DN35615_c0_g1~~TRINITY_DN35615_c0_g1_i2.p1  ORF type:complete len:745 (+),score=152.41 TRINITY_DN35615_c0_g1_i2:54-2288(+)